MLVILLCSTVVNFVSKILRSVCGVHFFSSPLAILLLLCEINPTQEGWKNEAEGRIPPACVELMGTEWDALCP